MLSTRPSISSAGAPSAGWSRARRRASSFSGPAYSVSASTVPVLLEVPARELVAGPLVPAAHPAPLPPLARLAAVRRRDALVDQIHLDGALRVLGEGTLRLDEVERPAEEHSGAVVPHAVLAH